MRGASETGNVLRTQRSRLANQQIREPGQPPWHFAPSLLPLHLQSFSLWCSPHLRIGNDQGRVREPPQQNSVHSVHLFAFSSVFPSSPFFTKETWHFGMAAYSCVSVTRREDSRRMKITRGKKC